jgi:hypothetical protein
MALDKETIIVTENGVRVSVSEWDDDCTWLHLGMRHGTGHAVMTRAEVEQLVAGLQAILAKEVTA